MLSRFIGKQRKRRCGPLEHRKDFTMQRRHVLASTILLGSLFLVVQGGTAQLKIVEGTAPTQGPKKELSLTQRLALASKLSEENADKFFQALGPVIRAEFRRRNEASTPPSP